MVGVAETTNDSNQSSGSGRPVEGISGGTQRKQDAAECHGQLPARTPDGGQVSRWIEGGRGSALLRFGRDGFRIHCGDGPNAKTAEDLMNACRHMRANGILGHWTYDLPLHRQLLKALELERAAIEKLGK